MIDKAATLCGSKSQVARKLGVSPQTLYNWQSDRRSMPDEKLDQLAHLAGYDPIKALGEYHHERMRKKRATPHIMRNCRRLFASLMRRDDRRSPFATCSQDAS